MISFIKKILQHRWALLTLARVDLQTTVNTTKLGWLWWMLDPLIMMSIYYFMVGVVFNRGEKGYHLFALIGIVSWNFFSRCLRKVSQSIQSNRSLLINTNIPLEIFTFAPTFSQAFFAVIGFIIILIWILIESFYGAGIEFLNTAFLFSFLQSCLGILLLTFLILIFAYAIGLFFGVLIVFVPDLSKFIDYGLRAGFFLTPILYPASRVVESSKIPSWIKELYLLNPIGWIISHLRDILLYSRDFDIQKYCLFLAGGLVCAQASLKLMSLMQIKIRKYL